MRIEVDRNLCEANAVCESIAPTVFRVTDDGVLEVLQPEPPEELRAGGHRGAALPPPRPAPPRLTLRRSRHV